ncbi:uncharacterized methyltransferase C25B8.09-like [Dendronephthya gigantea]|uniref:uncharacterized methyltransferase C25B8.09-like n=1 Tax=Dendronephthya gigantea TaxID=151771 RepID=UPI0010699178|nr:uncharacterized methyltransferase C25B8.09-like [Dendronephthya gigantea]
MDTMGMVKAVKTYTTPGIADLYDKTRPNYNLSSVEFLLEKVDALKPHTGPEPFTIVELGAGTGRFTRAVLEVLKKQSVENFKIIPTEPLTEMCEKFRKMMPDIEILQYTASDLHGLANNSADAILAGQSFHWFGMNPKAIDEIHRVLKPKAKLGIIWVMADRSVPWINSIREILDPEFEKVDLPHPANRSLEPVRNHGGFGNEGKGDTAFKVSMELDLDGVMETHKAYSVIVCASDQDRKRILQAIEREMKTNPDTKDKQKYNYELLTSTHWFEKI